MNKQIIQVVTTGEKEMEEEETGMHRYLCILEYSEWHCSDGQKLGITSREPLKRILCRNKTE